MIICIQPQTWGASGRGCGNGASRFFVVCFSNWDGAPQGVGALRKLRTLRIGSGGTDYIHYLHTELWLVLILSLHLHLHVCIWLMLLSKATYIALKAHVYIFDQFLLSLEIKSMTLALIVPLFELQDFAIALKFCTCSVNCFCVSLQR